jgi:hypothetical protein
VENDFSLLALVQRGSEETFDVILHTRNSQLCLLVPMLRQSRGPSPPRVVHQAVKEQWMVSATVVQLLFIVPNSSEQLQPKLCMAVVVEMIFNYRTRQN